MTRFWTICYFWKLLCIAMVRTMQNISTTF
jgi:hypothetical protein